MRNHLLMAALGAAMCVSSFGCGDDGSMPIVHDDAAMPPDTDGGAMTETGTLEVSADGAGGTVLVDGADKGVMSSMPMGIELPVGLHSVTVRLSGYVAAEPTVTIVRNETATVNVAVGRDLTGSWDCMSIDGRTTKVAVMIPNSDLNIVGVRGFDTFGLAVNGDSLTYDQMGIVANGTISMAGRGVSITVMDTAGTYTTTCTR